MGIDKFWLCALAIVMGAAACSAPTSSKNAMTAVRVEPVGGAANATTSKFSGTVVARTQVELAFKVGGYLHSLGSGETAEKAKPSKGKTARVAPRALQAGDRVTKDMVVATLRQADFKHKLSELAGVSAEASAGYRKAKSDYDRAKALFQEGTISQAEYEATQARFNGFVGSASAAAARASQAQLALSDSQLRSPIDGIVLERRAEVGGLVPAGAPVVVIADTSAVKVVFGVPDTLQRDLTLGQEVSVTTDAAGERSFQATITKIAAQADPKTRVFDVEATLDNADGGLKVGMVTTVHLGKSRPGGSPLLVPLSAVVRMVTNGQEGFGVFVVTGATASARPVVLGGLVGNRVEIQRGIAIGDAVVVQGATLLREGSAVNVVPAPSPVTLAAR